MTKRRLWLAAACLVYLLLTCYQLGLPGLHYDEAKEAGVNAVELLKGDPTTPFRNAALDFFGRQFPLMVQDYIGALNVYLALPLLALTGVGVPNLRMVGVLAGLVLLPLAALMVSGWQAEAEPHPRPGESREPHPNPPQVGEGIVSLRRNHGSLPTLGSGSPSWARVGFLDVPTQDVTDRLTWGGVIAAWLLAASPSFIFWSRQGIFVTNLIQTLCFLAILQGTRWLATGERRNLLWALLAAGLALYAKLLALWVIGPWLLLMALQWLLLWRRGNAPKLDLVTIASAIVVFVLPLIPLILFNFQTGGTLQTLLGNASRSYYGVDNLAIWRNGGVRLGQLLQSLRGDHFWYLGAIYGNSAAPWLALVSVIAGISADWRRMVAPLALLFMAVGASCFTISDLFITHYALIQPLAVAVAALGFGLAWQRWASARWGVTLLVAVWVVLDLRATLLYHQALAASGGLAGHSDATYHLAHHLQYSGMVAPLALDWGMDAPVRYLSANIVRPIEIFGYESPAAPDENFTLRLEPFLGNPDNVYLLHAPSQTVFAGRREAFLAAVAAAGKSANLEETFAQRDGTPIYELWRVRGE